MNTRYCEHTREGYYYSMLRFVAILLLLDGARSQVIGMLRTDDIDNGYAPWVEQWGATAVTLPSSAPSSEVEEIFQSINGLLLPGVTMYSAAASSLTSALVQRALASNDAGDYFPVWGTCKGYEELLQIIGGSKVLDSGFDAVDYPTELALASASPGRMLAGANASMLDWVSTEPITYNNHGAGITPSHLASSSKLSAFFDVIATSTDRKGKEMVELVEGKQYPIYGAQFHNEKPQFVPATGQTKHIPKSEHAKAFAAYMGSFLVDEARRNKHNTTASARGGVAAELK